jgi:hypothetical protein
VIYGWELTGSNEQGRRPTLEVTGRLRVARRSRCGPDPRLRLRQEVDVGSAAAEKQLR